MATSYGKNINISVYGGSHDPEIGVVAEGLPKDFAVDLGELYQKPDIQHHHIPGK